MKTLYAIYQSDGISDGTTFVCRDEAESWRDEQQPDGETWEVRTFVDLEDVCRLIREKCDVCYGSGINPMQRTPSNNEPCPFCGVPIGVIRKAVPNA